MNNIPIDKLVLEEERYLGLIEKYESLEYKMMQNVRGTVDFYKYQLGVIQKEIITRNKKTQ